MSNGLTRRQFLQAGAMAPAAFVVSGCTADLQRTEYLETYVRPPEEGLPGENLWYASTCRQCPAGCGILVRVSSGRARKVEGSPAHPLNAGPWASAATWSSSSPVSPARRPLPTSGCPSSPVREDARRPANLTEARFREYPDGILYSVVTQGLGGMPPLRENMTERQYWDVINFVHTLQP